MTFLFFLMLFFSCLCYNCGPLLISCKAALDFVCCSWYCVTFVYAQVSEWLCCFILRNIYFLLFFVWQISLWQKHWYIDTGLAPLSSSSISMGENGIGLVMTLCLNGMKTRHSSAKFTCTNTSLHEMIFWAEYEWIYMKLLCSEVKAHSFSVSVELKLMPVCMYDKRHDSVYWLSVAASANTT